MIPNRAAMAPAPPLATATVTSALAFSDSGSHASGSDLDDSSDIVESIPDASDGILGVGRWFRGELRELLNDQLSVERVRRKGLFDPAVIQQMIAAHQERREDNADALLGLLTFDMWHSEWIDR